MRTSSLEPQAAATGAAVPTTGLMGPLLTGFGGIVALCAGAVLAGSPFDTHLPGAWFFGMGHLSPRVRDLGKVGVFGGAAAFLFAWYRLIAYLRRNPAVPVRTVLVVFAVWVIPFMVAPPLFSQDAYSYVAQGTMVLRGANPYHNGPEVLTWSDPHVVDLVDPIWQGTKVPYGTLFLGLEAGTVALSAHHEAVAVEELRFLALGGILLAAAAVPALARRWRAPPALSTALVLLNPLTMFGLISPGHNDALMAGLLVTALWLAERRRPALAVAVCALAAGVKSPALVGTAFVAWQWASRQTTWSGRVRGVCAAGAITAGVMEALALATGLGWGWLGTMGTPGLVHSVLTPSTDLADLGDRFVRMFHVSPSFAGLLASTRALFYVAAAVLVSWLVWRSRRLGMALALSLALLGLVALGPVFQPWYLAWGLVCLAPMAVGRWRLLFVAVTTYGTVSSLPRFEPLVSSTSWAGYLFGLVVMGALAALCLPSVYERVHPVARRLDIGAGVGSPV